MRPDGVLVTPPLDSDVLPGVTRACVLALARELGLEAREGAVKLETLRLAEQVFVTNSVQEVLPLAHVDGHSVPGRDVALRLLAAYRRLVGSE